MNVMFFFSGAVAMCYIVTAMFFGRFWYRTRDRLFGLFSSAFVLLAVERVLLLMTASADELRTYVYVVRLVAFGLIIFGIIDKNKKD